MIDRDCLAMMTLVSGCVFATWLLKSRGRVRSRIASAFGNHPWVVVQRRMLASPFSGFDGSPSSDTASGD